MKALVILLLILTSAAYAQFETVVFSKAMRLNFASKNIYPLGDQNKDGYDDIMLYDCNEEKGYIYFGGNPMDTIPKFTMQFYDSVYTHGSIAVLDVNDDGTKDIFVTTYKYLSDIGFSIVGNIRIYYGGSTIHTKPDLIFNPPKGLAGFWAEGLLKDFNGDGRSELVVYDVMTTSTTEQFGRFYFYNTESKFDTIPHYVMQGDSVNKISIGSMDTGDINGDGKTDFTIYGRIGDKYPYKFFRSFYLGNANFDLTPAVTYYQEEHKFDLSQMKIVNDINGDGKDDILIRDYGYYEYYYVNAILHGSFPIDTIPDGGLNTQNEGLNLGQTYSLGDVNGDGYKDFISSTHIFGYQNVKLWLGGKWFPWNLDDAANRTWYGTSTGFGRILSDVGDVDGDGVNDIAIGQILYGNQPTTYCNQGRIYIIKGDTSVVTTVKESSSIIPAEYKLEEPHPNPFNPATTISYKLHGASKVSLKVYDVLGREAATLVNGEKQAGKYNVELDAGKYKLSSGVYFVKMEVSKNNGTVYSSTKKLVLLK